MSIKRGFNKKAQEGMSTGTLAAIVLVVVVVVLLIMGLSGALNPIFEKFNLFPGSGVAGLVKACDSYVQLSSKTDYCNFKDVKIDGKTEYVNCEDSRVQKDLAPESKNSAITCDSNAVKLECVSLLKQGKSSSFVNSQSCNADIMISSISCSDLNGETSASCPPSSNAAYTKKITSGFNGASSGTICCVAP